MKWWQNRNNLEGRRGSSFTSTAFLTSFKLVVQLAHEMSSEALSIENALWITRKELNASESKVKPTKLNSGQKNRGKLTLLAEPFERGSAHRAREALVCSEIKIRYRYSFIRAQWRGYLFSDVELFVVRKVRKWEDESPVEVSLAAQGSEKMYTCRADSGRQSKLPE